MMAKPMGPSEHINIEHNMVVSECSKHVHGDRVQAKMIYSVSRRAQSALDDDQMPKCSMRARKTQFLM
jgi:hypothetical protein